MFTQYNNLKVVWGQLNSHTLFIKDILRRYLNFTQFLKTIKNKFLL